MTASALGKMEQMYFSPFLLLSTMKTLDIIYKTKHKKTLRDGEKRPTSLWETLGPKQ